MRPKVVILILVAGFGLLGIMLVLKGVMAGKTGGQTPVAQPNPAAQSATGPVNPVGSSNTAASAEQMRAAAIEKELDAIQELQGEANGDNNPTIISALLDKVANPEAQVRGAALEALRQLNDTNAIPGLQQAVEHIQDPRGKVAALDVIDYLKLPNVMPDMPPADDATNKPETMRPRSRPAR